MAELERRAAPLLSPMITGQPSTLTMPEQLIVATWATKTAMVVESTLGGPGHFHPDQRRHVMEHDSPPGLLRVMASALEGMIPPLRYMCVRAEILQDSARVCDAHLYTLQVHMLVFQIVRPDPPPPRYSALMSLSQPRDLEVPVFPPTDGFFWPPKESFDNEGLVRWAGRIVDGTPPWPVR